MFSDLATSPIMHVVPRAILAVILWSLVTPLASSTEPPVDYAREIKPLLQARCYACHGALKQESSLRLDTAAAMLKGGDSGAAIKVGDAQSSPLFERVSSTNLSMRMPPEGEPLTAAQIAKLKKWIDSGAPAPQREAGDPDPREHWAFRRPTEPPIPDSTVTSSANNPIDAFILSRLKRETIEPLPTIDKATWLRRVTIDLIGLPPTSAELVEFESDPSPAAYSQVVDRLLADPRYGERWARHWMDVWRYADWHGRRYVPDVWNSAPQIWRWRDWIVQSLNQDRPYDQMVREMLAADEIAPGDDFAAPATGYLVRNWYALNPNDWMRANVEHVGKAFLGLTFNCAHCHDHKYDPITQEDYFKMRAFFEPLGVRQDRVLHEPDPGPFQEYSYSELRKVQRLGVVSVFDKNPEAPTWFYSDGDERNRVAEKGQIAPGVPVALTSMPLQIRPIVVPEVATQPYLRPAMRDSILAEQRVNVAEAAKALETVRAEHVKRSPDLRRKAAEAQAAWIAAAKKATPNAVSTPLSGAQSLLFIATEGRRVLQNPMTPPMTGAEVTSISFQLRILADAHFNFQLSKDLAKGLTAGYVGFEKGKVLSYQPKSTTEFQVATYDLAAGERSFDVSLSIEPAEDRCLLSIRCRETGKQLVDEAPVALGGWNPTIHLEQGILFDARTGSVIALDELRIERKSPEAEGSVAVEVFDFESAKFPETQDIEGVDGWAASHFSAAPAVSLVAPVLTQGHFAAFVKQLFLARRSLAASELTLAAAEANAIAQRTQLSSIEARLSGQSAKSLHDAAAMKLAEAAVLAAQRSLALAESLPETDDNKKKASGASTQLGAARASIHRERVAAQSKDDPPFGPRYPAQSTGRRKALAEWITSPENPLTARVAVNHIWMRHFHKPLVESVFDFGRNGAAPTHPELLDYLSVQLMNSNWNMKDLHRQIVLSDAYRRASVANYSKAMERDPDNRWLWRANRGRMEAEVVRDSLIHLAGKLDSRIGGQELENDQALTTFRRSLYYSCQPENDGKSQFSALFDAPESTDCYRRTRSIIPQQALALTNNELVHEVSLELTKRLERESSSADDVAFITAAYKEILTRAPSEAELRTCTTYLAQGEGSALNPEVRLRNRSSLVRVLLNHHDFISIR
jgi:mono/diheme cytochrome c family protein